MIPAQLRRSIDVCVALAVIASLLFGLWPMPAAQAQTTRTPTIRVGDVALGGVLRIAGYGFAPGQTYNARLVAGRQSTPLGQLTVQRNGELTPLDFPLPRDFVAASYSVEVTDGQGALVANTGRPVTVHPAPIFSLNPTGGAPGTPVTVNASGLLGGSLRLLYAGAPVLTGRVNADGTYIGQFVVPNDRPRPLGSVAQVTLQNLRADQRIGQASGVFNSAPEPEVERPRIEDLTTSRTALRAGMPFSLTGRIVPPPGPGRVTTPQLTAIWQDAQGTEYALPSSRATIAADGSFVVTALAPSYVNGDPLTTAPGDKPGVAIAVDGGSVNQLVDKVVDPLDGTFRFSVVKSFSSPDAGKPVPNTPANVIYVNIQPRLVFSATLDTTIDFSQVFPLLDLSVVDGAVMADNLLNQSNAWMKDLANCFTYNEQSAIPWWEWRMTPEQAAINTTLPANALIDSLQNVVLQIPQAQVAAANVAPGTPVNVVLLNVLVDALGVEERDATGNLIQKGYGPYYSKDGKKYAMVYEQLYAYIPELDLAFYVVEGISNSPALEMPFKVYLPPLPTDVIFESAVGKWILAGKEFDPSETTVLDHDFYSFVDVPAPNQVVHGGAVVRFTPGGAAAIGTVEDMNQMTPIVTLDGVSLPVTKHYKPFPNKPGSGQYCYSQGVDNGEISMEVYFNASQLLPGMHRLSATIQGLADGGKPQELYMKFVPLPVNHEEIKHLPATGRTWTWGMWLVTLDATALKSSGAGAAQSSSAGNLKEAGQKENAVALDTSVRWQLGTKGSWIKGNQEGTLTSQSLSNAAADLSFGAKKANAAGTDALAVKYDVTQTILDTGKLSIFKAQYGIPSIASVGISVDFQVTAVAGIKTMPIATTVGFDSSVKIWAAIEAEILMGLASAEVGAVATIGVGFNTTYALGGGGKAQECFHYRMDLYYEIEALWGAATVASGEYNLFAGADPSGCKSAARSLAQRGRAAMPSPALATDGYGNTLALWRAADGRILSSVRGADDWLPPQVVHNSGRSIEPAVAFFDVNRAVAVWAESNREAPQTRIPVYEAMRTLHLRYALWDNGRWGPAADLTLPTSGGDGRVVLAACMATDGNCPPSGEVTALWVHDEASDIRQRHFRIYSATLRDGAWTSPVAVDEGGAGSRTEPTLAYADGVAVAAWVYDPDRTLDSMMDRRLHLRTLDGSSSVVQPAAIPGGVVSPHLAADGKGGLHIAFARANPDEGAISNRRLLHYAVSACPDTGCPSLRSSAAALNDRSWTLNALVDPKGRGLVGESPVVTLDNAGKATVTLRMLGLNPIAPPNTPLIAVQEPLGVMAHTGELAQIEMGPSLPVVMPTYLTFDGALNWQPNAIFDPLSGNTFFMAVTGSAPDVSAQQRSLSRQGRNTAQVTNLGDDLIGGALSRTPNFVLGEVELAQNYFHDEQPVQATVTVHNSGASWQVGDGAPLTIAAAWDGPVGWGDLAAETTITALGGGESLAVTLQLAPPARSPKGEHLLYVVVNPHGQLTEQSLTDNEVELPFGSLPAPVNLFTHAPDGAGFLVLQWAAVDDTRVVGYKVYRVADDGSLSAAGSSPVAGWRDSHPACAEICRYVVTAYTDDLQESAFSDEIAAPKPERVFEPPTPLSPNRLYLPSVTR
ncbi:hypothetical protein GC175_33975 [bacterium]|nr:hypothetical protein [bacterium]